MNKKLLANLKAKCKDFGLNNKALEELATIGSEGISDESSDEDIENIAETLVPYAKAMQAEVTRKLQGKQTRTPRTTEANVDPASGEEGGSESNDGRKGEEQIPSYLKKFMEEMREENKKLSKKLTDYEKKEAASIRKSAISAKAKELEIPEHLMKRFAIGDDEDITEVLTEFKQSLVDNGLPMGGSSPISSSSDEEVKEDAMSWAKKLPD